MQEGEIKIIKKICKKQECEQCGETATYRLTFLLHNARTNPASKAYGRDDCTWCSDAESFACNIHAEKVWRDAPTGMGSCAKFDLSKLPHMGLYWHEEEVKEMLASDFMKQFSEELNKKES